MDHFIKIAGTEGKVDGYFCRLPPLNENTGISILMMYLCKFGHNISTRCSDKMQIKFLFTVGGVFGIVKGMEKSSYICI